MKHNLWVLVIIGLIAMSPQNALNAAKAYYTWVDENGITNFSERDPKNYRATYVSPKSRFGMQRRPAAPVRSVEPPRQREPNNQQTPDNQIGIEQQQFREEIARARQSNCDIGKRNLAKLKAFARIRVKDADGNEKFLSEEEKQQRMEQARITINENCGNG